MEEQLRNVSLDKIRSFRQIESAIPGLEEINLDKRKEEAKLKIIAKENLKLYLDYLSHLLGDLEKAKSEKNFFPYLDKVLANFNRNSRNAFEKATILIGELGEIKKSVKDFSVSISTDIEQAKSLDSDKQKLASIKELIKKIYDLDKNKEEITSNVSEIGSNIKNLQEKKQDSNNQLEEAVKSEEYLASEKTKQEKEEELKQLDKELQSTKDKIDLKLLVKHYYTYEDKASLVRNYIDNFRKALMQDAELRIIKIVREGLSLDISSLQQLKARIIELEHLPEAEIDKKIKVLNKDLSSKDSEIKELEKEIVEENKKIAKLEEKKSSYLEELKNSTKALNIELVI